MRRLARLSLCLAVVMSLCAPATGQHQPLDALLRAAEAGETEAQVALADRLRHGHGVPQDFAAAAEWYRRAGDSGDPVALNQLGRMIFAGLVRDRDQAAALSLLEQAAATGAPDLLFDLANALENADGDLADPARAAELYERAAGLGLDEAAVSLAALLIEGKGTERDPARALRLLEPIADGGHAKAANNLGLLYVRGEGVEQDYARAAAYFRVAAQSGLPEGLRNLGVLHENGFGVTQDDAGAAELYRQAASLVAPDPATTLTLVHDPRLAPPPTDPAQIARLLDQAEAGDPVALALAGGAVLTQGTGYETTSRAVHWLRRAAHAGHGYSMANLGVLYIRGNGVLQDYVLGYTWLSLAQAAEVDGVEHFLDLLLTVLTSDQIAEAQHRASELWGAIRPRMP